MKGEEAISQCCGGGVLPGDLMVEILQRLPVKSLLRFKSVSKDWLFLILSPRFIAKHLIHHQRKRKLTGNHFYLHGYHHVPHCRNDASTIMFAGISSRNADCCPKEHHQIGISLISKGDDNDNDNDNDQNDPFSTSVLSLDDHIRKDVSILGSSDGLVCFKFRYDDCLGIWNPATRKIKFLPSLPCGFVLDFPNASFGFSYVPRAACYKLVQISILETGKTDEEYVSRVQVLNIGEDRCWREVLCQVQGESTHELPSFVYARPIVVDGCLYWFGTSESSVSIVWFDMEKEVFVKKTVMPYHFDEAFSFSNKLCNLTVFEENLALFVSPYGCQFDRDHEEDKENKTLSQFHQLWIYERENHTWKKKLTFGPLPSECFPFDEHFPVGFWNDREIIIRPIRIVGHESDSGNEDDFQAYGLNAYMYNPYSNVMMNFPPCRERDCNFEFYPYVESLVQI